MWNQIEVRIQSVLHSRIFIAGVFLVLGYLIGYHLAAAEIYKESADTAHLAQRAKIIKAMVIEEFQAMTAVGME